MNNVKVSVIVPVYNVEKYLEECIESILAQTLEEVEVVLVNDGSTDTSPLICNQYEEKYSDKVIVVNKENGGLTSAWKAGCEVARGDYIGFADADDYVLEDMFERLYAEAIEKKADMVCCGLIHRYEDGILPEWSEQSLFSDSLLDYNLNLKSSYSFLINNGSFMGRTLQACRVTKLVKRSLILENLGYCDNKVSIGEDLQFSFCMFLSAKRIAFLKDYYPYIYRMNGASMTMKYDVDYLDKIKVLKDSLFNINNLKSDYDFTQQIINDYLCLVILHIKGGIYKRKHLPYIEHRKEMVSIRNNIDVSYALKNYDMPNLTIFEKLFILLFRKHLYFCIFLAIRIYFNK